MVGCGDVKTCEASMRELINRAEANHVGLEAGSALFDYKFKTKQENGMAAYAIGAIQSVSDPVAFSEYGRLTRLTLEQYGGKIVVGGSKIEVADGTWSPIRMVVIEFESLEHAKPWYYGPEYQAVVGQRI